MLLAQYTTTNTDIDLAATGAGERLAQSFKLNRAAVVGRLYLYIEKTGAPTGYLWAEIYSGTTAPTTLLFGGQSDPIACSSVDSGWATFDFDIDARPKISADTLYWIVLRHTSYDAGIAWSSDQEYPHYINGAAYTYDGTAWAAVSPAADFAFKILSGRRSLVYSALHEVEGLSAFFTDGNDGQRFNHDTHPSIQAVLDFQENNDKMIDGWLTGAGLNAPLTTDSEISIISQQANHCVALDVELTQRTAGFYTQEGDTRAAALRRMCDGLRKSLTDNDLLAKALRAEQGIGSVSSANALTAGHINVSERDDARDDTDIIQPLFRSDMFDNI
jgi:hypothetical protein